MSCDICNELERLSEETWERIRFTRTREGLKLYETTLTQNILFSFKQFQEKCNDYSISLFESIDEKTNGNDIELIIETSSGYLKLPTQAKLLYNNLKYKAINHSGDRGYQIDDLIHYASTIGGIPLYLLYNYVPSKHPAYRHYGCSMITAEVIKYTYSPARNASARTWKIPSFDNLHPSALPWHQFICGLSKAEITHTFLQELEQEIDISNIQFYTIEEIESDGQWQEFTVSDDTIPQHSTEPSTLNSNTEAPSLAFRPKFRVVISSEQPNKVH